MATIKIDERSTLFEKNAAETAVSKESFYRGAKDELFVVKRSGLFLLPFSWQF